MTSMVKAQIRLSAKRILNRARSVVGGAGLLLPTRVMCFPTSYWTAVLD